MNIFCKKFFLFSLATTFSLSLLATDELDRISTNLEDIQIENEELGENLKLNEPEAQSSRAPNNEDDEEFGSLSDDIDSDIESSLEEEVTSQTSKPVRNTYKAKASGYNKNEKLIEHPNSSKGLFRITKDRKYLYKAPPSEQKHAASVRFGMFNPENLTTENKEFAFSDLYQNPSAPLILVDYEWQYKFLGKVSLKAGSGFYFAQGSGRFNSSLTPENYEPQEDFSLFMFPNSLDAVYKLQIWDDQILVPYASAGVDLFTFMELVDGGGFPRLGGSVGGHFALGGSLNINFLDRWGILNLDREYGINSVWLTAEYRNYFHITGAFDFSGSMFNGGLAIDF